MNDIYRTNVKNAKIDYYEGTAKFASKNSVSVTSADSHQVYSADHILIASGSYPEAGTFEGAEHCITSDGIFAMEELPNSMVVLGGGYIAVEIAQVMQAFGVKTTLLVRDIPLRQVDKEITDLLVENMKKLDLDVRLKTPFTKVTKDEASGKLSVHTGTDGEVIETDKVLIALGRPPNVLGLGLEEIGVQLEKGSVKVDEHHNSTVGGIYAIGDAIN